MNNKKTIVIVSLARTHSKVIDNINGQAPMCYEQVKAIERAASDQAMAAK